MIQFIRHSGEKVKTIEIEIRTLIPKIWGWDLTERDHEKMFWVMVVITQLYGFVKIQRTIYLKGLILSYVNLKSVYLIF